MGQSFSTPSPNPADNLSNAPPNHPSTDATTSPSACPVDHKSREAWLKAAQQHKTAGDDSSSPTQVRPRLTSSRLSSHREVSSIPRGLVEDTSSPSQPTPAPSPSPSASHGSSYSKPSSSPPDAATSSNAQTSDPHTSPDGTWVYPSEEMFFNAMRRKNYSPKEKDMSSIIPIHNAVNERTWSEVLKWERPNAAGCLIGPKLVSFEGESSKLTPRARWYALLGYEKPFDRHDWVVDRCGTRVEYVIDFYQGKAKMGGMGPSFYLDVRPKVNSWEGCRMRMMRATGFEARTGSGG